MQETKNDTTLLNQRIAWDESNSFFKTLFINKFSGRKIDILEAGCGQSWPLGSLLKNTGIDYILTGVDASQDALTIRQKIDPLNVAILADLKTVRFDAQKFDVIYCSFVLEHVDDARNVLLNFISWLKTGGILILRIPDQRTVYGFLSKITPFWFHVFYYKYILGRANAGKPGYAPFRVNYDPIISRYAIIDFCRINHLNMLFAQSEPFAFNRFKLPLKILVKCLFKTLCLVSAGSLSADRQNFTCVIEK